MALEIERKFRLVRYNRSLLRTGERIDQGHLCLLPEVRVRTRANAAFVTVKSEGSVVRKEFEYQIPVADGRALLDMCRWRIAKTRYTVGRFEVDLFEGALEGLVLLEVELSDPTEMVQLPPGFDGVEVSDDERFKNKNLARIEALSDLA